MGKVQRYGYHNEFVLEFQTPEDAPEASISYVHSDLSFFAISNDHYLHKILMIALGNYLQEYDHFTLFDFIPYFRQNSRDEITYEHRLLLGVLDRKSQTLRFVNFGLQHILFKDKGGLVFSARENNNTFSSRPTPFRINVYPLQEMQAIFLSSNHNTLAQVQNHFPAVITRKQISELLKPQGDDKSSAEPSGSFVIINCFDEQTRQTFFQAQALNPDIEALAALEADFENKLVEYQVPEQVADNAGLVFHELLLNAFEHGILGMTSSQKQELIRSGEYEDYVEREGKNCQGSITITGEFFDNHMLRVSVEDTGSGFNYHQYLHYTDTHSKMGLFHNRGIRIAQERSDGVFYTEQGRRVHFIMGLQPVLPKPKSQSNTPESEDDPPATAMLSDVSLLYVEDDELTRELYVRLLKRMTKKLYIAVNGQEGLDLFFKFEPDIVLSDIQMPIMNGLDMAKEIRQHNRDVPILLITAFSDKDHILSAIDAGVDRFINKPVQLAKLKSHLEHYARIVHMEQQLQKRLDDEQLRKEEEFFALKDKSRRDEQQQRQAFAKEQLIIHNDAKHIEGISCQVFYRPQDILSGDIYGIFRINSHTNFFYIIDSMGKGLGASVTAILSAAFINQTVANISEDQYHLSHIINSYADYIRNYLLDDEVVSLTMACLNIDRGTMEYASFGMYPILVKDVQANELHEYRTNNLPLMIYSQDISIRSITLPRSFQFLIYSDGLCENDNFSGTELRHNFMHTNNLDALLETFFNATAQDSENYYGSDDTSIIHVSSQDPSSR
ncbi:response regulator [Desulfurispira natronophila]|uniref:CheY-like chemotaxis protein n=1 Tax=Desulfurispira natronophila TaxID=682562 RepID=A0A7W8DGU1_9BACT|nr:response regulator [Desulfurispira natronophila]MBB5021780.1 CheY-like chemotaxis protein [Desulfurispira natronophila]